MAPPLLTTRRFNCLAGHRSTPHRPSPGGPARHSRCSAMVRMGRRQGRTAEKGGAMPTIAEPRDLFLNELKAMLYVEQKLADQVLPELAKEVSDSDFKESLREHTEETKRHVANVERIFELLGEEPKPDKSHAVDGLVAQHDKVAKNIEST